MIVIPPIKLTDAILVSSDIAETDYDAWDAAVTYDAEDRVISIATHSVYESLINTNLNNTPDTDDGTKWLRVGATNRWKAFDNLIDDQVSGGTPSFSGSRLRWIIKPGQIVTSVAFFGLDAKRVRITSRIGTDPDYDITEAVSRDLEVVDRIGDPPSWWNWFFVPREFAVEAVLLDVPYYGADTEYVIDVLGDDGATVKVGQIVFGRAVSLAVTSWQSEISVLDFSRVEDDEFGNVSITRRRAARLARFPIGADAKSARGIQQFLFENRTSPMVWVGDSDERYGLLIYGISQTYRHIITIDNWSTAEIEVRGLV